MEKPNKENLKIAEDVCEDLANYINETEPYARNDITVLRNAADVLFAFNQDDNLEGNENGESPTTEN